MASNLPPRAMKRSSPSLKVNSPPTAVLRGTRMTESASPSPARRGSPTLSPFVGSASPPPKRNSPLQLNLENNRTPPYLQNRPKLKMKFHTSYSAHTSPAQSPRGGMMRHSTRADSLPTSPRASITSSPRTSSRHTYRPSSREDSSSLSPRTSINMSFRRRRGRSTSRHASGQSSPVEVTRGNFFDIDHLEISLPQDRDMPSKTAPSSPTGSKRAQKHALRMMRRSRSRNASPAPVPLDRKHTRRNRSRRRGREKDALVVDNITLDSKLFCLLLGQLGYRTTCVGTGEEALDLIGTTTYDLILIDTQLPSMDARTCARHIRHLERTKGQSKSPLFGLTRQVEDVALKLDNKAGMSGAIEKGAVMAETIPKVLHLAQRNPGSFFFASSHGKVTEHTGLARTHAQYTSSDKISRPTQKIPATTLS